MSSSRCNLLFVVGNLDVGGMERLIVDMAIGLTSAAYQVTVCTIERPGKLAPLLQNEGVDVISLDKPPGLSLSAIMSMRALLANGDFNLVHTHNETAHFYASLANRALLRRLPLIHTKHGQGDMASKKSLLRDRLCVAFTDCVVAVSDDAMALCESQIKVPASKLCTVVNGVNLQPYLEAADSRVQGPGITFGHVGRLDPIKNQAMLLRVFARFVERHPDARLVLVGDGPLKVSLQETALALGLGDKAKFLGYRTDIPQLVAGFDCFVMSSVSEGTPLSVIEAMAAECAVVSTDVGGLSSVVEEGITGHLVPSGDEQAMLDRWLSLAADATKMKKLGVQGRSRAEQHFGLQQMLDRYIELYECLLPENDRRLTKAISSSSDHCTKRTDSI